MCPHVRSPSSRAKSLRENARKCGFSTSAASLQLHYTESFVNCDDRSARELFSLKRESCNTVCCRDNTLAKVKHLCYGVYPRRRSLLESRRILSRNRDDCPCHSARIVETRSFPESSSGIIVVDVERASSRV